MRRRSKSDDRVNDAMFDTRRASEQNAEREAWKIKKKKFAHEFVKNPDPVVAARTIGLNPTEGRALLKIPDVQTEIEEGLSQAAIAAGISRKWVLEKLREVVVRCLQGEPVLDREGNETGEWKFDSGGANRALELIGKHIKLFGDDSSAVAQLGTAVIRVLAQEAQAGRIKSNTNVQPTETTAEKGPITDGHDGTQTSLPPLAIPHADARASIPNPVVPGT